MENSFSLKYPYYTGKEINKMSYLKNGELVHDCYNIENINFKMK